jgi:uncharacterized protein
MLSAVAGGSAGDRILDIVGRCRMSVVIRGKGMGREGNREVWAWRAAAAVLLAAGLLALITGAFPGLGAAFAWLTGELPVWAAVKDDVRQRVYDRAGLFSDTEEEELESELSAMWEETGMDVVLVTTEDAQGKTAEQYADDFFDENGFGADGDSGGILYLIDMDNRELYISTYLKAIRFLTDERIDRMLDRGISRLGAGDFVGCAKLLLEDTREYYEQGIGHNQYNQDRDTGEIDYYQEKPKRSIRWYEALLALAVSAFCAGSVCRKVRRDYRMEKEQKLASGYYLSYRADAAFRFRDQRDELRDSHVTRQVIPRATSVRSAGGRSSGRSTTHTSGSGRVHGGGGRKF